MKIQFIGATHEVTGSSTLLEVGGRYYMVDCGMEQGTDVFQNIPLPVSPGQLEAIFLTHAHIDHSGMLPKLYKDGFKGSIYATHATCDLCNIMLRDSAHIQESEAQWRNRKNERAGEPPVEPTYTLADAEGTLRLFRRCNYAEMIRVGEGVALRLTDIGHLLGSAAVELWLTEGEETRKIVFSGDVGNQNQPIINNPKFVEETDYLVLESTYGNRNHPGERSDAVADLAFWIQRAFDRGGNVVIPSFAVGRTQEMLYAIREIKQKGMVTDHPDFPVYVDSPLAVEATGIFLQCDVSCLDEETWAVLKAGYNPIWSPGVQLSVTAEESKAINFDKKPKVILSASGMCEAGRIRHHLKHNLWRSESTVVFVGFQGEGTLGRTLLEGAKSVKLFGEQIAVNAELVNFRGLSSHADRDHLMAWIEGFRDPKPQHVFVVHGDREVAPFFAKSVEKMGFKAHAPQYTEVYDLIADTVVERGYLPERKTKAGGSKTSAAYERLVAVGEMLMASIKRSKGRDNKSLARFADQLRALLEKWESQ
jgi:metallo-beta-lactamase family protein